MKHYSTDTWNPLLLAISQKHTDIARLIFSSVPYFHKICCISKPYAVEEQKGKVFTFNKRLKRECFSLKHSILNRDLETLKFLWHENRLLWNLGHFFQCLRYIMRSNWVEGLHLLIQSTTTKVLLMSINNLDDFLETLDILNQEITYFENSRPQLITNLRSFLNASPYFIYSYFLELSYQASPDLVYLDECLRNMSPDDIHLKHVELKKVFKKIGSN